MEEFMKINDPNNKYYKYALKKEMSQNVSGSRKLDFYPPFLEWHPILTNYRNKLILGEEQKNPLEYYKIFQRFLKPVDEALTIGTGSGWHQKEIEKLGLVKKWISLDLVLADGDQISKEKKNEFIEGDLNFIHLGENKYDMIFCVGVLHHIINLEHLLFELNKSLKPNGVMIVIEATTMNKWQWEKERINYIENNFRKSFPSIYKDVYFQNVPLWYINNVITPFESIRAEDLPILLEYYFSKTTIFKIHWNHLIYPFLNTIQKSKYEYDLKADNDFISFIIELEGSLTKQIKEKFSPTELMGIFKKNDKLIKPKSTKNWEESTIRYKLGRKREPLHRELRHIAKKIKNIFKV